MENPNPIIFSNSTQRIDLVFEGNYLKEITQATVFELIRDIQDPEHPQTLEELGVLSIDKIKIYNDEPVHNENTRSNQIENSIESKPLIDYGLPIKNIEVSFKPTIPHCSMASFIGLCIKIQLIRHIPNEYFIRVLIPEGMHSQFLELNKQLNDKDRIMAAMENENLKDMIYESLPILNIEKYL